MHIDINQQLTQSTQTHLLAKKMSTSEFAMMLGLNLSDANLIKSGNFTDIGFRKLALVCAAVGYTAELQIFKNETYLEAIMSLSAELNCS